MPKFKKRDDALWLSHLASSGVSVPPGFRATIRIDGTAVEFVPMSTGRDDRATAGLKATGPECEAWNAITKGTTVELELVAIVDMGDIAVRSKVPEPSPLPRVLGIDLWRG